MPYRSVVSRELAALFAVLSHPLRLRIVEELHTGEKDVNSLSRLLQISASGVSQHLAQLRAHRLIVERKQGRNVFYHLRIPEVAPWVLDGLSFIGPRLQDTEQFLSAVEKAREQWLTEDPHSASSG